MGIGIGYSHFPCVDVYGGEPSRHSKEANITGPPSYHIWARTPHPENPKLFLPPPQKWEIQKYVAKHKEHF